MNSTGAGSGGCDDEDGPARLLILRLEILSIHRRSFSCLFSGDGINGGSTSLGGGGSWVFRWLREKSPPIMVTVPIEWFDS